jgi:hypothetical protein
MYELIDEHEILLKKALTESNEIMKIMIKGFDDDVFSKVENRDRLVSILETLQFKIEDRINNLSDEEIKNVDLLRIKRWMEFQEDAVRKILSIDEQIVQLLESEKDESKAQLAHIFKNRLLFKGYNLSNTKS